MHKKIGFILLIAIFISCSGRKGNDKKLVSETELGIIDAHVYSEETNLKRRAEIVDSRPGKSVKISRSFENAPPLIPHTTTGFFPIKINSNICLSCHVPDKAEEVGAIPMPEMHYTDLRTELELKEGKYHVADNTKPDAVKSVEMNNAYFNCSQCHVPQTNVRVDIENLFTPEFRSKFGLERSDLSNKINEGIN